LILDPLPDQIIDGELCGEGLSCEDDSSDGEPPLNCYAQIGATFNAIEVINSIAIVNEETIYSISEKKLFGVLTDQPYGWELILNIYRAVGDNVLEDTVRTYYGFWGFPGHSSLQPTCYGTQNGDVILYYPGEEFSITRTDTGATSIITSTTSLHFSGCNPYGWSDERRNEVKCCGTGWPTNIWTECP